MISKVILLTACINPNGMSFTAIQNVQTRLDQYKEALNWYLKNTKEKIVFAENSLSDFSCEYTEYINSGRLEYITFDGNNYDRNIGKGYGEALIIKMALLKSHFIAKSDIVVKITGRLIIKNYRQVVFFCRDSKTLYANSSLVNGQCLCYSVMFITPKVFLSDIFLSDISSLNDSKGYFFEHLLYDSMIKWKKCGGKHLDFLMPLNILGISGSTGEKYVKKRSFMHLKALVKYFSHLNLIYKNHI